MKYLVLITLIGSFAYASDYKKSVKKLEENQQNAEHNFKEYKNNLEIVDSNLKQVDTAINDLSDGKKKVKYHLKNSEKNKTRLAGHKTKIDTYIKDEEKLILSEEQKLARLMKKVKNLQKNIEMRKLNVAAYNNKKKEIDKELGAWQEQQDKIASLIQVIDKKEKKALSEKKKWSDKRTGYALEMKKWKKESVAAKSLHKKYDKFD